RCSSIRRGYDLQNFLSPRSPARALGRRRADRTTDTTVTPCDSAGNPRWPDGRWLTLAHVWRQLQQSAAQPADTNYYGKRQSPCAAVDVPDGHARQFRDDLTLPRQRPVCNRTAECGLGPRRTHRPANLALPARAATQPDSLLRSCEPWVRRAWRQTLHGHA